MVDILPSSQRGILFSSQLDLWRIVWQCKRHNLPLFIHNNMINYKNTLIVNYVVSKKVET